jgi:hypothetical protein
MHPELFPGLLKWIRANHLSVLQIGNRQVKRIVDTIQALYTPADSAPAHQSILFITRSILYVALYFLFEYWSRNLTRLPYSSYTGPPLSGELLQNLFSNLTVLAGAGLVVVGCSVGRKSLLNSWRLFEYGTNLRWLIGLVAFVTTWIYAISDYNFYFDQLYVFDRLLLIALLLLLWWKPIFVLPYTLVLMAFAAQFTYPLADQGSLLVSVNLLVHTLQLFSVFMLVHVVTGTRLTSDFLFVLCCMIGASYVRSGVGKLMLGWLAHPNLIYLLPGGYSNGWLAFLSPEQVAAISQFLMPFRLPMMLFTLVVELGALVFLFNQRVMLVYLLLFVGFHAGVAALCGIFFWHWIVLELALLLFFYRTRAQPFRMRTWAQFALSVVLIGGGFIWFRSVNLAWYDTGLYYSYRYEAITQSSDRVMLPASYFSPYEDIFIFQNFNYLTRDPQLTGTYGVSMDSELASAIVAARTPADVFALEGQFPLETYRQAHVDQLTELMGRFIRHVNQHEGHNPAWWAGLHLPGELLSFTRAGESAAWNEPIERVIVWQYTSFFDGEIYSHIRQRIVLEVPIPPST